MTIKELKLNERRLNVLKLATFYTMSRINYLIMLYQLTWILIFTGWKVVTVP